MGNSAPTQRTVKYPSGNVYEGFMLGSKKHGAGTLKWADGARYDGDWVNDEMAGNGRLAFPNGSVFEGGFSHNNPYGQGTLTTINGERLTGNWQFHGRGANNGPVGKYMFDGSVYDPSTGKHETYSGWLALHLTTGLVALPGMTDPTASVMPFAHVVGAGEDRKILHEASAEGGVPQAKVVEAAPSGIAYGYQDPALRKPHADDHAVVDLMDPRLWLVGLGINPRSVVGDPHNFNAKRQAEIRAQEAAQYQPPPPQATGVAQAVPIGVAASGTTGAPVTAQPVQRSPGVW